MRTCAPISLPRMNANVVLPSPGGPCKEMWLKASPRLRAAPTITFRRSTVFSCPVKASKAGRTQGRVESSSFLFRARFEDSRYPFPFYANFNVNEFPDYPTLLSDFVKSKFCQAGKFQKRRVRRCASRRAERVDLRKQRAGKDKLARSAGTAVRDALVQNPRHVGYDCARKKSGANSRRDIARKIRRMRSANLHFRQASGFYKRRRV